jgi:hypothetical protein
MVISGTTMNKEEEFIVRKILGQITKKFIFIDFLILSSGSPLESKGWQRRRHIFR